MEVFQNILNRPQNTPNGCYTVYGSEQTALTNVFEKSGCCMSIIPLMQENRWWGIDVEKSEADATLKDCGVSLEEYMAEIVNLGFPPIHSVEVIRKGIINYYRFYIDNHPYSKSTYYLFCWIRHLYYYQAVVANYFHYLKEWNITEQRSKMRLLGFIAGQYGCHTVIITTQGNMLAEMDKVIKTLSSFENNNSLYSLFLTLNDYDKQYDRLYCHNSIWFESFEEMETFIQNKLKEIPPLKRTSLPSNISINGNYYVETTSELAQELPPIKQISMVKGKDIIHIHYKIPLVLKTKEIPVMKLKVLSRHPSHDVFRNNDNLQFKVPVLFRLGSTTNVDETKYRVHINSVAAIQRSSNKLLMKQCFDGGRVPTTQWTADIEQAKTFEFPIVAKHVSGSRGSGNYKLDTVEQLNNWAKRGNRTLDNYIFEKFVNTSKEYRIHVSINGVFLAWRKLRKNDTPENQKWFFNNINCNWIGQNNELFDTPKNWNEICKAAQAALQSVGLTVGAVDVRVQSNKKKNPEFYIIEINSAPSMSPITTERYITELNRIVETSLK